MATKEPTPAPEMTEEADRDENADEATATIASGQTVKQIYKPIIEWIFEQRYTDGATSVEFEQEDITQAVAGIPLAKGPKNPPDVIYTFRYRRLMPDSVQAKAPDGMAWIIRGAGLGRYRFVAVEAELLNIKPNMTLQAIKIPDATPGIIAAYAFQDEQALLAKIRYNRLLDIFTGATCYSLQSHLRTQVQDIGQLECDELYVGVDTHGAQYVFPVEAKGAKEKLGIVQIEQDIALCAARFPNLIRRPIGAQFAKSKDRIALFEFVEAADAPRVRVERHYKLVPPHEITDADLAAYKAAIDGP